MDKKIFVINGSGGVGKDTFVNMVAKYVPTVNFSSVDKVKEVAKLAGWKGSKTDKDRKFLSELKDLIAKYNDMPYKSMISKIESFEEDTVNEFLFLHIREPEEIKRISSEYNVTTILVKRPIEHINSNRSDAEVDNYNYDLIIQNDGDLTKLNEVAMRFSDCVEGCDYNEKDSQGVGYPETSGSE